VCPHVNSSTPEQSQDGVLEHSQSSLAGLFLVVFTTQD
jgi:hypothetical protein